MGRPSPPTAIKRAIPSKAQNATSCQEISVAPCSHGPSHLKRIDTRASMLRVNDDSERNRDDLRTDGCKSVGRRKSRRVRFTSVANSESLPTSVDSDRITPVVPASTVTDESTSSEGTCIGAETGNLAKDARSQSSAPSIPTIRVPCHRLHSDRDLSNAGPLYMLVNVDEDIFACESRTEKSVLELGPVQVRAVLVRQVLYDRAADPRHGYDSETCCIPAGVIASPGCSRPHVGFKHESMRRKIESLYRFLTGGGKRNRY